MCQSIADTPPTLSEKHAAWALAVADFSAGRVSGEYYDALVYANEWWEERYVPLVRFIIEERPAIPEKYL